MSEKKRFLSSWSGGKDSCYAVMQALKAGMIPKVLLNMMNENGKISRSHGIPERILKQQAEAIGIPLKTVSTDWNDYEEKFIAALKELREMYETEVAVFGDIDLQDHRDWEEKVCNTAGLQAYLPLWKQDRKALILEMLSSGIKTCIVSCNETLGSTFLGRIIDHALIAELESKGVDPCGENGEYHTLVLNCPIFREEVKVEFGNKVLHNNYWFIEMEFNRNEEQGE